MGAVSHNVKRLKFIFSESNFYFMSDKLMFYLYELLDMCSVELKGHTLLYIFRRHHKAKYYNFGFNEIFCESCLEKVTS